MTDSHLTLDAAVDLTRTGDLWLFRGRTAADQAIRVLTNAPVNHVGMAVVLDDLPPLMWHAELGKGLRDVWSGTHHRGVQLHDLREAVDQWTGRYEQHAWLRQLDAQITPEIEAAVLTTIARLDGTPFPATAALVGAVGARPGTSSSVGRDDLLRRGGRRDVHRDGPAGRPPADQLLRPRDVLVRRRPGAAARGAARPGDPGPDRIARRTVRR